MSETRKPIFESNGLLDFFPTPPQSTEDNDIPHPATSKSEARPERFQYEDDDLPPPDFDEEPSDFEDEVLGIMEREAQSSSSSRPLDGMDIDDEEEIPVASCMYLNIHGEVADNLASRPKSPRFLTPPPDDEPRLQMLPDFAASIESIAPLRVETASGKKVIFRRRAKPVPKAIPVCPLPVMTLMKAGWKRSRNCRRVWITFCSYT